MARKQPTDAQYDYVSRVIGGFETCGLRKAHFPEWISIGFLFRNKRLPSTYLMPFLRWIPKLYFYLIGLAFTLLLISWGLIVGDSRLYLYGGVVILGMVVLIFIEESRTNALDGSIRMIPIGIDDLVGSLEARLRDFPAPSSHVRIKAQFVESRTALLEVHGPRVPVSILMWKDGQRTVVHIGRLTGANRALAVPVRGLVDAAISEAQETIPIRASV